MIKKTKTLSVYAMPTSVLNVNKDTDENTWSIKQIQIHKVAWHYACRTEKGYNATLAKRQPLIPV